MQTGGRSKLLAREDVRPSMQDLRCALLTSHFPLQAVTRAAAIGPTEACTLVVEHLVWSPAVPPADTASS